MAEEANSPAPADATKNIDETARVEDVPAETTVAEDKPAENGEPATATEAREETGAPADGDTTAVNAEETTAESVTETKVAENIVPEPAANGTPVSKRGGNKRKSISVPEHKKKTPSKKKGAPELRLNVQPGEYWFVAMRGFPPWPVIVCDEEMLPETLLSKRPVSAKRIDGTYREDFREGGKNAKDRRYPIMFLGTNEFAWQVNTDLQPLIVEDVKREVDSGNQGKKSKALWEAYQIAAEGHDLQWFKDMLEQHEKALLADLEEKAAAEAKKLEKKEKTARRKSAVTVEQEDEEMEDVKDEASPPKKAKASKKRKKEAESDDEPEKPAKTPKTKLKLNSKTPKEASATKPKKETKAKSAKAKSESEEVEPAKVEEQVELTPAQRQEKREKSVLYLRHRLQKGFLTRDQAPKEEEMGTMSDYFKQLEAYTDLEAEVIKKTKVHKVLKAIIKLNSIPKEEEYQFKKRSNDLLNSWKLALSNEVDAPAPGEAAAEPATNGVQNTEKEEKAEAPATLVAEKIVEEAAPEPDAGNSTEESKLVEPPKAVDAEGDVDMKDSKDEVAAKPEAARVDEAAA